MDFLKLVRDWFPDRDFIRDNHCYVKVTAIILDSIYEYDDFVSTLVDRNSWRYVEPIYDYVTSTWLMAWQNTDVMKIQPPKRKNSVDLLPSICHQFIDVTYYRSVIRWEHNERHFQLLHNSSGMQISRRRFRYQVEYETTDLGRLIDFYAGFPEYFTNHLTIYVEVGATTTFKEEQNSIAEKELNGITIIYHQREESAESTEYEIWVTPSVVTQFMEFYRGLPDVSFSSFLMADKLSMILSERYHIRFEAEHGEFAPAIFCDSEDTKELGAIDVQVKMSFPQAKTEFVTPHRFAILNADEVYTYLRKSELDLASHLVDSLAQVVLAY